MRKIAFRKLRVCNRCLDHQVVELDGTRVVRYYPLVGEQPQTEWSPREAEIKDDTLEIH